MAVNNDIDIIVVPVTDDNREDLKWLALAVILDGKTCCFCGYPWTNRESVKARAPIKAG